jgi:hypothetical protein
MEFDELDAISEWVGRERPIATLNGPGIVRYFASRGRQYFEKVCEITDEKCWMCFLGRTKFRLHTQVELE